jgi:sucrose phosphorylase
LKIWTTFSGDQIDLNYGNPEVLYDILETLLFYVSRGAEFIRLDAVAYLWKEPGTSSINLPQTHAIIQIIRSVLDEIAPLVTLITETNLPHKQNISYFGNGFNEAQMVYNFSLPPLVINAFHTGNVAKISSWASDLETPSSRTTWFNFLASHDGIGLMPALGILDSEEISNMANRVEASGGQVSYRSNANGSKSPYELNVNFLDALGDPEDEIHDQELIIQRFWASQAIMLCLQGVPAIYFHSLFGSRGWNEGVETTGRARSINREKLIDSELRSELSDKTSFRWRVYEGLKRLLQARQECKSFHPAGGQRILNVNKSIFACLRTSIDEREFVFGLHNVSSRSIPIAIDEKDLPANLPKRGKELVQNAEVTMSDLWDGSMVIQPYGILWISWKL